MKKIYSICLVILLLICSGCDNGKHTHAFVDGICSCGKTDSTYDPNILKATSSKGILSVEYNKEICYTQRGLLKVSSKYEDDEITIRNLSTILYVDDEATDDYILLAKGIGEAKIQVVSKYQDSITLTINVIETEEFSAIKEISIGIKEEGPYYMGRTYHLDLNINPANYIDKFEFLKSDEYILNLDTMEIMFKHSGKSVISCYAEQRKIRVNQEFNILIDPEIESYEILFIGNSLTYVEDIPNIIYNMITHDGAYVSYLQDTVGGSYLDSHQDKFNEFISKHNFTHIILQEQSAGTITNYNRFIDAVLYYNDLVKDRDLEVILYQTWGYDYPNGWNGYSKHEMTEVIKEAYDEAASMIGGKVSRSGEAFTLYETMYEDLPSLYKDVNHQSIYGAYLSACVHYGTITGKKAVDNTYQFVGIEEDIAQIIREVADKVVFGE